MNISYSRRESAPNSFTTSSGFTTFPLLLLILWARADTRTEGSDLRTYPSPFLSTSYVSCRDDDENHRDLITVSSIDLFHHIGSNPDLRSGKEILEIILAHHSPMLSLLYPIDPHMALGPPDLLRDAGCNGPRCILADDLPRVILPHRVLHLSQDHALRNLSEGSDRLWDERRSDMAVRGGGASTFIASLQMSLLCPPLSLSHLAYQPPKWLLCAHDT